MRRRDFVKAGMATWVSSALGTAAGHEPERSHTERQTGQMSGGQSSLKLENDIYLVEVDGERGLLYRLVDKISKVDLIAEPRLADNFRLLLPLPEVQANYICGKDQRLTSFEAKPHALTLRWNGPLRSEHGAYDLDVTLHIRFIEQAIEFRLDVRNGSKYRLAEVWYPILGGVHGFGSRHDTQVMVPDSRFFRSPDLFRNFRGNGYDLGPNGPEYNFVHPGRMPMSWVDLCNAKIGRGVYMGCHDPVPRFKVMRFELLPGPGHARQDPWPRPEEVGRETAIGVLIHWIWFPCTPPGETFEGPPVQLQFHEGDWHNAASFYRRWFTATFRLTDPRASTIHQEMAFQMTMLLLPEGNLLFKFKDVPRLAREALEYGVKALLICGWNVGGHDAQYPSYTPDPRVGTWDDLAAAIRACHKMGVKVFMFANMQPVDLDTDWYRKELHRYATLDLSGRSDVEGFGMGTVSARVGYTRRNVVYASLAFPEFRRTLVGQMRKLAELGADGIHFDKLTWAQPPLIGLDFNPNLRTSPDRATWEGILTCTREILDACREVNPNFCISQEGSWDRMIEYSDVAWHWQERWEIDYPNFMKFTFPQWIPALPIDSPGDYNMVNNALRYGYQIMVGPDHYTASLSAPHWRSLGRYIQEALRIREELKQTIYLGEFLDNLEATVKAPEDVRFSTHRNPQTRKRACVLVNLGDQKREASVKALQGNQNSLVRIHQPFLRTGRGRLPINIQIPPERFVIVVEE